MKKPEIEVGTPLLIDTRISKRIEPVIRETKTLWITRHYRIKKRGLRVQGLGPWSTTLVSVATKSDSDAIKKERMIREIKDADLSDISLESVVKAHRILITDTEE